MVLALNNQANLHRTPLSGVSGAIERVERALVNLRAGKMVVLLDSSDRENEGDLVMAASYVTPESINFMATHGRGLICLALTADQIRRMGLIPMTSRNTSPFSTAFTVSIEAAKGVVTGISAADRAETIRTAIRPDISPLDIVQPGHVFPIEARANGVFERQGQTEGSVDLARLSGLTPAAVICEVMNRDGSMARRPELEAFANEHHLHLLSISDIIDYRLMKDRVVSRSAEAVVPTDFAGDLSVIAYSNPLDGETHLAFVKGPLPIGQPVLTRIHSECFTGDVLGSERCDCGQQLHMAMKLIEKEGSGVIIYMRQEGRGIGLVNKLKAYALQDHGADTVEANHQLGFGADQRDYRLAVQILRDLEITQVRLLTNNPDKMQKLEYYGVQVTERIALETIPKRSNRRYLQTKRDKLGHLLSNF